MIKELPTDSLLLPKREALRECRQFINDLFVSNSGEGMKFVERILYKLEPKTSTFIIQRILLAEEAFSYKSGNLVKSMNQKIAESKWATNNLMRYFNPESVIQVGQKLDSLNDLEKLNVIGKGNKERSIYLNQACIDAINSYLPERPNDAKHDSKNSEKALFLSSQRTRISKRTVENIVSRELQRAGLDTTKYSTHKLRHTAATLMYKYGKVDIRALQELLGHQSISTTEIYTHVDNDQVRSAIEANPLSDFKPGK